MHLGSPDHGWSTTGGSRRRLRPAAVVAGSYKPADRHGSGGRVGDTAFGCAHAQCRPTRTHRWASMRRYTKGHRGVHGAPVAQPVTRRVTGNRLVRSEPRLGVLAAVGRQTDGAPGNRVTGQPITSGGSDTYPPQVAPAERHSARDCWREGVGRAPEERGGRDHTPDSRSAEGSAARG